jgi:hypothetical protein
MRLPASIDPRLASPVRRDLEAARWEVLNGIANTDAGRRILAELVKSDTYVPIAKPTILARIYRGPDGLYLGHAAGLDGKIIGNARWVKLSGAGSRLLTSASMITGHLMLVEISNKLDRVRKDVEAIREALDDDRLQSLRAAIEGVHNALEARNADNKHALMLATIPGLQKAIHQTIAALKREIGEIPLPKEWKVSKVFSDREPEMRSKLAKSEKTFHACLEGISILGQAYFSINERVSGCRAVTGLISELQTAGINDAEFKARLLTPSNEDDRPENLWGDFRRVMPEMIELFRFEVNHSDEYTAEFDVELLPAEIEAVLRHGSQDSVPDAPHASELASRSTN